MYYYKLFLFLIQWKNQISMVLQIRSKGIATTPILSGLTLLVAACGGNYQAPVSDQGERQVINAPIIIDSAIADSSLRIESPRPIVSTSTTNRAAPVSASVAVSRRPVRSAVSPSASSHRVGSGDTLFSIAFQYDLDFRSLALANGLSPPYTIFVDQEINLDIGTITPDSSVIASGNLGTAVSNNSIAKASAGKASSSAVLGQAVTSSMRSIQWQWPHQGRLLRGFQRGINKGLDIAGGTGDPVLAAGDGDVVYSGRGIQGTGDLIIIRHSGRYLSAYAHNSVLLVNEGSHVRAGEKIAEIGKNPAGVSMLHFEIREDGGSVDPSRFLPSR